MEQILDLNLQLRFRNDQFGILKKKKVKKNINVIEYVIFSDNIFVKFSSKNLENITCGHVC